MEEVRSVEQNKVVKRQYKTITISPLLYLDFCSRYAKYFCKLWVAVFIPPLRYERFDEIHKTDWLGIGMNALRKCLWIFCELNLNVGLSNGIITTALFVF